jgi:hypothetical protein
MTQDERDALLGYLEFNLTTMVEQIEVSLRDQLTPNALTGLYDKAYEVLYEIERSLNEVAEFEQISTLNKKLTK